tara:strand:- start:353 stop:577 length:225 start_codon:yes stop_codon:yes gene_type:complete
VKLIANLVEWSKWDVNTIMDMPFTPTMLIVNAVISEQQKNQENRDLDSGDKQNIFADIGKLKGPDLDKYYESDG